MTGREEIILKLIEYLELIVVIHHHIYEIIQQKQFI